MAFYFYTCFCTPTKSLFRHLLFIFIFSISTGLFPFFGEKTIFLVGSERKGVQKKQKRLFDTDFFLYYFYTPSFFIWFFYTWTPILVLKPTLTGSFDFPLILLKIWLFRTEGVEKPFVRFFSSAGCSTPFQTISVESAEK